MRLRITALVLGCAAVAGACSWSRFDDLQKDAPVLLLNRPDSVGYGFGSSLAFAGVDAKYRVLAAASPGARGAAEYEIGSGQGTNHDAVRVGYCRDGCTLGRTVAALRKPQFDNNTWPWCFAVGFGSAPPKPDGIVVQCEADPAHVTTLALPGSVIISDPGHELTLAAEDADAPLLLASAIGQNNLPGHAWVYDTAVNDPPPAELDPAGMGAAGSSYGAALAVLHAGGSRRLAVGEPDVGRVVLFDDSGAVTRCLSGPAGFGRSITAGQVSGSGDDELVVADAVNVHVIDGSALTGGTTGCEAIPGGAELALLSCKSTADVSGCGGGEYGASLAIADFDRDGDGEVLVGAPGMSSRDESSGGAVLIYDVEPDHPDWLNEAKFISSAESGDRLGAALAVVHQPDRDIFLAGAPGNGKTAVFFCPKLLPSGKRGSRCQ